MYWLQSISLADLTSSVKIYVAAVEAVKKKERHDETQFTTKIVGILSFTPPLNANVLFSRFFFNLTFCMTELRVLVLRLSYFTDNFIISFMYRQNSIKVPSR